MVPPPEIVALRLYPQGSSGSPAHSAGAIRKWRGLTGTWFPNCGNMNSMASIPVGTRAERTLLVTGELAVDFLGNDQARVLATPFLIGYLELTARDAVKGLLGEGYDTVGTHVDLRHLAATPLGMAFTCHAEVTGVDGRRIRYRVWAEDETEKVAEGTHERYIIQVATFAQRVTEKATVV